MKLLLFERCRDEVGAPLVLNWKLPKMKEKTVQVIALGKKIIKVERKGGRFAVTKSVG